MNVDQKETLSRLCATLIGVCPDRRERLNMLMHIVAADLKAENLSPAEVAGYLVKITQMLDGQFDRSETAGHQRAATDEEVAEMDEALRRGALERAIKRAGESRAFFPLDEHVLRKLLRNEV